ncbi:MAG: glycosyltransferase, partial [Candidatus Methylumidiphilus sp.]
GASLVVITHHGTTHPYGLNAIVEAMAMSKPVIMTKGSGIDINPFESGFGSLVPAGDSDALATEINNLMATPERIRKMGILARNIAESQYSTTKMTSCLDLIIKSVTRSDRTG